MNTFKSLCSPFLLGKNLIYNATFNSFVDGFLLKICISEISGQSKPVKSFEGGSLEEGLAMFRHIKTSKEHASNQLFMDTI